MLLFALLLSIFIPAFFFVSFSISTSSPLSASSSSLSLSPIAPTVCVYLLRTYQSAFNFFELISVFTHFWFCYAALSMCVRACVRAYVLLQAKRRTRTRQKIPNMPYLINAYYALRGIEPLYEKFNSL